MQENETKQNKEITWSDVEISLATEIISEIKSETRKWFSAWLITAALLVLSNLLWYVAYNM